MYICILLLYLGSSASTISLLVVGGVFLFSGAVNEVYTKRSPIIPPRLFRVSSTVVNHDDTGMLIVLRPEPLPLY